MLNSKADWKITKVDEQKVIHLSKQVGLSTIATRFLVQRGMETKAEIDAFLHMNEQALHDPYQLKDMDRAVGRINRAIEKKERILVFGDYDADGVTSTALMYMTLKQLDADVGFYVPNRFTEGYGPNEQAFRHAADENVALIITVDTGISAVHEAGVAKQLGIDLIITDHHEPPPVIPDGFAVVNPKQTDCSYPNKNLAGVGVAFKVSQALLARIPQEYYDLVAIGTIADLVSLQGENRLLAMKGIQSLSSWQRPGLKALLERSGSDSQECNEETIGFLIGPRLNAAGRLESADPAIELLLTEDASEANELSQMIEDLNKERQQLVKEISKEAEAMVDANQIPAVIIVGDYGWNPGVIGIVASRLVEKYYRPTIVMSFDEESGLAKGSARSIEGFDMFQSLSQCREILPHFGGHPMAAGLTMETANVQHLNEKLSSMAIKMLSDSQWRKSLTIDLPISMEEISIGAITDLQQMAPFGMGNPAPKLLLEDVNISMIKKIGSNGDHLKLILMNADKKSQIDGIGFRMGNKEDHISPLAKISIVGKLTINEWNGQIKPQFIIEDLSISERQLFDLRGDKRIWQNHQRLSELTPCTVVYFQEVSQKWLPNIPSHWQVVNINEVDRLTNLPVEQLKNVLILDLPTKMKQLKQLFEHIQSVERIYAAFINEVDHFFETIPTRNDFKWFYGFLLKRRSFDVKKYGKDLAKHKGWTENSIHFMCQVFFELKFVKIDEGIVEIEQKPSKKELTESETYQNHIEQSGIEHELYYSSYRALKQWIDQIMEEKQLTSV